MYEKVLFCLAANIKILRIENDTERIAIGELNKLFYGKSHDPDCTPVPVSRYQIEETDFEPQKSVEVTASTTLASTRSTRPNGHILSIHFRHRKRILQAY